jgi:hypothetical protein
VTYREEAPQRQLQQHARQITHERPYGVRGGGRLRGARVVEDSGFWQDVTVGYYTVAVAVCYYLLLSVTVTFCYYLLLYVTVGY